MKIDIDEGKCTGAGQCVLAAPQVFDQRDEDAVAVLLDPAPSDELLPQVADAISRCPALAITLRK